LILQAVKEIESIGIKAIRKDNKSLKRIAHELIGSYNGEHLKRIPNEEDTTWN